MLRWSPSLLWRGPSRRWHRIRQQLFYAPTMIRKPSRHRWRPTKPQVSSYQTGYTQALVLTAEVVDSSHKVHRSMKSVRQSNQGSCSTRQTTHPLTKGSIETLDETGVEYSSILTLMAHLFDLLSVALHYSMFDFVEPPRFNSLDDLGDQYLRPSYKPRSPWLSSLLRLAKYLSNCAHIRSKPVRTKQESFP